MTLVNEIDYGTPFSKSEKTVTLTIDGVEVTVPEGTSIMRAAMEVGTKIPKLCAPSRKSAKTQSGSSARSRKSRSTSTTRASRCPSR